jgi:hypothetical protein
MLTPGRCGGDEDQSRDVVLTGVAGTLESVDAHPVDSDPFGLDSVPDAGALVQHLDAVGVECGQVLLGIEAGGLHDFHTGLDDRVPVLCVRRRVDGRQDGEVDPERVVGHVPAALKPPSPAPRASAG